MRILGGRVARVAAALALLAALPACGSSPSPSPSPRPLTAAETAFLDTLERRTFDFFWERTDARTGLTPDRWPTKSFVSVAAVGFALTAYPIGAERGYVSREDAAQRALNTLRFFWTARQGSARTGITGYRGFFYHFLDPATGHRFEKVELSTIDTALMLAGALFCQSYFDHPDACEDSIRALADSIYARVEWTWFQVRPPLISLAWSPEEGHLPYDWKGYNETMLLHILALGAPRHAVGREVWPAWTSGCRWGIFYGQPHIGFPPLFGHQYTHVWIDLRGIRDSTIARHGIDWFENSRRATLAQRAYAIANPSGFAGYGERLWGLSACDGPMDQSVRIGGRARTFRSYEARGASFTRIVDDGTIAPTAAGGSVAFAPEIAIPVLMAMRQDWGENLFSTYGFLDAMNPTLSVAMPVPHGRIVPGVGWFDTDYLGIDQGPILAMIENLRSELVWRTMRKNVYVVRGLRAAGFTGGWLEGSEGSR